MSTFWQFELNLVDVVIDLQHINTSCVQLITQI